MSILLLGANGQVGWRLKQQLGDACIALTRAQCDFATLDAAQAEALVAHYQPDIIVNAVGFTAVDAAEQQRDLAMRVNAQAPALLAHAAGNVPFIHLSTDYVFDGTRGSYREDAPTSPLNAYGESKLQGERLVMEANPNAYVFRLQWLYDSRGTNFFLTMQRLLREKTVLRVVADQFGAPTSAPLVAQSLAQVLPMIGQGELPPGIYHLACAGHTSWHGFAAAIAARMDEKATDVLEPITSAEYPTPAPRPSNTRLDCGKLAAHGIVLPHWHTGLDRVMEELHAHR